MRGDGDGWALGSDGERHWGKHGAAGLLLRAPDRRGAPQVLLQHRASWSHEGGTWALLGGARDSDETTVSAAVREAFEEGGIEASAISVRAQRVTAGESSTWTYTTVVADASEPLATTLNAESVELRWVPEDIVGRMSLHPAFALAWPGLRTRSVRLAVDTRVGTTSPDAVAALAGAVPWTIALPDDTFGWVTEVAPISEAERPAATDVPGAVETVYVGARQEGADVLVVDPAALGGLARIS